MAHPGVLLRDRTGTQDLEPMLALSCEPSSGVQACHWWVGVEAYSGQVGTGSAIFSIPGIDKASHEAS